MPVLAVQPVELGRTAVFCGDTTRAWQQGPRVRDERSPFLQFWGQMVRWLAGRSDRVSAGASVTARVEGANYRPGQQIEIVATVRDRRGEATDAARATATVNTPEGQAQQVELSPDVGTPGRYTGRFKPRHVGNHTIDVQAKLPGNSTTETDASLVRADPINVDVGRESSELDELKLNDRLLAEVAARGRGGQYEPIATADRIVDRLQRAVERQTVLVQRKLYSPTWCWVLFVGVLTAEWILRRRARLR